MQMVCKLMYYGLGISLTFPHDLLDPEILVCVFSQFPANRKYLCNLLKYANQLKSAS